MDNPVDEIALHVAEIADGADPDIVDQDDQISHLAAGPLGDWCYVALVGGYGIKLDQQQMSAVKRLVASAMLRQHDYTEAMWYKIMEDLETKVCKKTAEIKTIVAEHF